MKYSNPKNPTETIESTLTVLEAKKVIWAKLQNDAFALSLANKLSYSSGQMFWLIKKAEGALNPQQVANPIGAMSVGAGFLKLANIFKKAVKTEANPRGLKYPKITFKEDDGEIVLSLAGAQSKNPNHIYVKYNGVYQGKINPEGVFFPAKDCEGVIKTYLKNFAENPTNFARAYGQRTGNCCFCSIRLTDGRSVAVGYGPICAGHYGLPWGDVKVDTKEEISLKRDDSLTPRPSFAEEFDGEREAWEIEAGQR
jgi:hypothetical protein